MNRKILLVGQDRIGKKKVSDILANCQLPDFSLEHNLSINSARNMSANPDVWLVLVNVQSFEKLNKFLMYQCRKSQLCPVILIYPAERKELEVLISIGVCDIIHPENVKESVLTQAILSAIEQKRVESELRSRDAIMRVINFAAEEFLTQLDWDSRIGDVLTRFGNATQSDKLCIYKNSVEIEVGITAALHVGWAASGEYELEPNQSFAVDGQQGYTASRWADVLQNGGEIIGSVMDFPPQEQSRLSKRQIQSLAVVPILSDQIWWGFITIEHCRVEKQWTSIEIDALKTAARIFGAGISRLDAETRLTHLATHDFLTDLPNRMLLADRFDQAVARAERSKKKFGVIAIDLDKFKLVNDVHGHPFGDKVLIEIAWRLSETVRTSDTCARVGGDEFTVLAEGINNKRDLMRVMEKIALAINPPIDIEGKQVFITASMGGSIFPNHGSQIEELMKAADIALYQVKDTYSGFKIFSDGQISLIEE